MILTAMIRDGVAVSQPSFATHSRLRWIFISTLTFIC